MSFSFLHGAMVFSSLGTGHLALPTSRNFRRMRRIAVEDALQTVCIEPGLHLEMPANTLHVIEAGPEGCEFIWTFAAARWSDILYIYLDSNLPNRNVKVCTKSQAVDGPANGKRARSTDEKTG